jgi:hypothetical protein
VPSRFGSRRARGVTSQVVERGGEGGLTVGHHVLIAQRHAWVQALIIARDMGASRLGSMIEEKLLEALSSCPMGTGSKSCLRLGTGRKNSKRR